MEGALNYLRKAVELIAEARTYELTKEQDQTLDRATTLINQVEDSLGFEFKDEE